jgi:predicted glutamine amidotransferase
VCELLALSSSQAARLTFSLRTLAGRGGLEGHAHDGWGVAFYDGLDVALFREPGAAADSALVHYLENQGPATGLAISHIRHATRGEVSLANTQPFVRELGGRTHVFAHNGDGERRRNLGGVGRQRAADRRLVGAARAWRADRGSRRRHRRACTSDGGIRLPRRS